MSTIGTRIRDLRISKGMTQTALCGDGISSGYVSLIESGKRTPSEKMVREIARRLGVPEEELLQADEGP
ncbi:MAG TPA: helix-turn-helix transcriptional regulator, partial [Nocardioidaceae bacterium]|nr:helix-turn-helix transcriptional regulator [Nocardioidaceae bacterium]